MRLGLYSAIALVALPLMANAQSASQNLAQLEKAVRVQQWICTGIADVRARGGLYSPHQLALCLISLAEQKAQYERFLAGDGVAAAASTSFRTSSGSRGP
jgi:hypothetical protein